jgi:hypothetical protein
MDQRPDAQATAHKGAAKHNQAIKSHHESPQHPALQHLKCRYLTEIHANLKPWFGRCPSDRNLALLFLASIHQ